MRVPFTSLDIRVGERTYSASPDPPMALELGSSSPSVGDAGVLVDRRYGELGLNVLADRLIQRGSAGADGESWYGLARAGGPDINPALIGRAKFDTFHEMAVTDPACRSLIFMYLLPGRAADWGLVPPKNDPDGEDVARARMHVAAQNFGLEEAASGWLDLSWDEWLQQTAGGVLKYGCMGEEIIWGDIRQWTDADGDQHYVRPIARFAPRYPATVSEIEDDPKTGLITRFRQDIAGATWIPGPGSPNGAKGWWYVMEREGNNWWGQSLLRSAYGAWLMKKGLLIGSAIGWDRFAAGTPVVWHPEGEVAKRQAQEMARAYRNNERAFLTFEGPKEDSDWAFEIVGGNGTLADPVPLLRFYNIEIALAGQEQFGTLGTTDTGSRAAAEVISEPYYLAVQSFWKYIATQRARFALRRFYDVNFGAHIPTPEVVVSKIQGRNVAVIAKAIADLSLAGFTFTDRDTQNDIRDTLDLRHLPEDLQAAIVNLPGDIGIEDTLPDGGGRGRERVPVEGAAIAA